MGDGKHESGGLTDLNAMVWPLSLTKRIKWIKNSKQKK